MKKKVFLLFALFFCLVGCSKFKSYTFSVNTGDKIMVKLDVSAGYDIDSNIPFTIKKGDDDVLKGSFITSVGYEKYLESFNNSSDANVIETVDNDNIQYTFYEFSHDNGMMEYDFVCFIKNSKTGVLIGSTISKDLAKEAFDRLTFSIVD